MCAPLPPPDKYVLFIFKGLLKVCKRSHIIIGHNVDYNKKYSGVVVHSKTLFVVDLCEIIMKVLQSYAEILHSHRHELGLISDWLL